jgi:hypothetical protein
MTQTTQNSPTATDPAAPCHPGDVLISLIIALLAPIFLGVTGGDVPLARLAAMETVNDYRARNNTDLVAIAQIIACGLAALGSLSRSMADELSLSMTLRLRGNAVSLNRSAEQNRRVLRAPLPDTPDPIYAVLAPEPEPEPALADAPAHAHAPAHGLAPAHAPAQAQTQAQAEPEPFLSPAAEQLLAAESRARLENPVHPILHAPGTPLKNAEQHPPGTWAIAMANQASAITAGLPNLPPAERPTRSLRAAVLCGTANGLLTGSALPPPVPLRLGLPNRI